MNDNRYISDGTWFDQGTEAFLLVDCSVNGLFLGVRHGEWDEEICSYDEFIVLGRHSE